MSPPGIVSTHRIYKDSPDPPSTQRILLSREDGDGNPLDGNGIPADFFAAYDASWPPSPGRDERIPLYQLYHLLNHLNLFGEGYGGQVDGVLRRYGL